MSGKSASAADVEAMQKKMDTYHAETMAKMEEVLAKLNLIVSRPTGGNRAKKGAAKGGVVSFSNRKQLAVHKYKENREKYLAELIADEGRRARKFKEFQETILEKDQIWKEKTGDDKLQKEATLFYEMVISKSTPMENKTKKDFEDYKKLQKNSATPADTRRDDPAANDSDEDSDAKPAAAAAASPAKSNGKAGAGKPSKPVVDDEDDSQ